MGSADPDPAISAANVSKSTRVQGGHGSVGSRDRRVAPDARKNDRVAEKVAENGETKSAAGESNRRGPETEKGREKEKEKTDKDGRNATDRGATAGGMGGYVRQGTTGTAAKEGLPDDALSQVAAAKFESQEEKLKDVARFSVSLIRDFVKLSPAERTKRVGDVRRALMKYEMQFVRAQECQEKRRQKEILQLSETAQRYRKEAEEGRAEVDSLRGIVEKEKTRRRRFEEYEATASEVNKKNTRDEYKASIDEARSDIEDLKRRKIEQEALVEERIRRAQLLTHAVAELAEDLRHEQTHVEGILANSSGNSAAQPETTGTTVGDGTLLSAGMEQTEVLS